MAAARVSLPLLLVPLLVTTPNPDRRSAESHLSSVPLLAIGRLPCRVSLDGRLDEPCYSSAPAVSDFVIASRPAERAAPTQAWIFWNDDGVTLAFDCKDGSIQADPVSGNESDVDRQDRVELFLWSGNPDDQYFCVEIGARGAVQDYAARFYRKFDSSWQFDGLKSAVSSTDRGYQVEARLPATTLGRLGFSLTPGSRWRLGLFRADFTAGHRDPQWITWVDARTSSPDFHVADAFGGAIIRQASR